MQELTPLAYVITMKVNRLFCLLFALLIFVFTIVAASAEDFSDGLYARNACVFNVEYHKMVYGKHESEKVSPGQTAKIMTAIIAMEYYKNNPEELIEISSDALKGIYKTTVLDVKAGEKVPAKDLINSMLISGANDSANALAIAISGSITAFAQTMNERATEIGATSTHFTCPTGLDGNGAYTTAYDIAVISAYAYTMDGFMDICNTRAYNTSPTDISESKRVFTRNYLISSGTTAKYYNTDASGILVGYTDDSNWCLVTSPKSGSFQYIIVCMNCDDSNNINVYYDANALIKWCKNAYSIYKVLDSSVILGSLPVELCSVRNQVSVSCESDFYSFLPVDYDKTDIRTELVPEKETLTAPIVKRQCVGKVKVYYKNQYLGESNLVSNIDAPLSSSKELWHSLVEIMTSKVALITIISIVVLAIAVFMVRYVVIIRRAGAKSNKK
ncbi:MAG: hypothetical protein K6F14_05425 [Clostridiales bacterium]|nr:hypothetical protein [Clostridiales bacterium]